MPIIDVNGSSYAKPYMTYVYSHIDYKKRKTIYELVILKYEPDSKTRTSEENLIRIPITKRKYEELKKYEEES